MKEVRVHTPTGMGSVHQNDLREALLELLADPEMSRAVHLFSDVDKTDNAQHHTLGSHPHQAKHG